MVFRSTVPEGAAVSAETEELDAGCEGHYGYTALHFAAGYGHEDCAKALLQRLVK